MNFKELLLLAKDNEDFARKNLIEMYKPLLLKESTVDGVFDEDLYQELCMVFMHCIEVIRI
ncbi:helix-turn-helix domain-containing protein [Caproiciproducens sp. R1]|uniref:helix-turn-helix domain-containing protein n=1 Tax=Caproiciproducens sp. R1 TaxID=3435000 RepID=UPI004033A136